MADNQQIKINDNVVYALDFDGVICDSAIETSITAWKAAQTLWQDMPDTSPSKELISDFRKVRPYLETGYEAILIMRLLQQGLSVTKLCNHYQEELKLLIHNHHLDTKTLKHLFGKTRDHWIKQDRQDWLNMNPFFEGIQQALKQLEHKTWYIITTKQTRFVELILQANNIKLNIDAIYGMERQMSKVETLLYLNKQHAYQTIVFIEDRLPTLVDINAHPQLQTIELQLASWGYNTPIDRQYVKNAAITLINIEQFLSIENKTLL